MNQTTRYLLGLILVLALCLVALEWNTDGTGWIIFDAEEDDLEAELELSPLHRDEDEVPMMVPNEPQEKPAPSEELHLVDEDVEFQPEQLEFQPPKEEEQVKPEDIPQPEAVDMYDAPVDLRVVEDLPQFPGGAVEFMKWLTKNLKYPANAQNKKIQGRVKAQFIINKDGSISDLELVEKLDPWCDREALRVLRMMPKWEPGVMDAKPCRTLVAIPIYFKL